MGRDQAENVAISALGFIAGRPDDLGRFLALSGIEPAGLRQAASDPAFLGGLLEFVVSDEPLLLALAGEIGVEPATVPAALHALRPSGDRS